MSVSLYRMSGPPGVRGRVALADLGEVREYSAEALRFLVIRMKDETLSTKLRLAAAARILLHHEVRERLQLEDDGTPDELTPEQCRALLAADPGIRRMVLESVPVAHVETDDDAVQE